MKKAVCLASAMVFATLFDLLAGEWCANVHTAADPGGELRGQMAK